MNAYYTSALICGIIIAVLFAVLVALEICRVYRTQINTDLAEDNRRLRMEVAYTRAKHADAVSENSVHTHMIKTLNERIEELERENEELKAGHPVVTGYTFVKKCGISTRGFDPPLSAYAAEDGGDGLCYLSPPPLHPDTKGRER